MSTPGESEPGGAGPASGNPLYIHPGLNYRWGRVGRGVVAVRGWYGPYIVIEHRRIRNLLT